jgi:hypothetical protein
MVGKAYSFPADKPTPPSRADIERAKAAEEAKRLAVPTETQKRKRQERREVAELMRVINRYLRQHNPDRAEKRLWGFGGL